METRELQELRRRVEAEGAVPGTPEFEFRLDRRKVERCQELRNVSDCRSCNYFEHCELAKRHLIAVGEVNSANAARAKEDEKRKRDQIDAFNRSTSSGETKQGSGNK